MFVKDLVKEAKNGNIEVIKELEIYYLDIFKNNVKRFCGEECIEEAMYDYSSLIEEYLNGNYVEKLENFLRRRARLYPKEKIFKRQLGDKINFNNEVELNFIIDHYTDTFYEKIKCFNSVLDENDLYVYALNLIKHFVFTLNFSCDIRVLLNARIYKELEYYKTNNELIIKKYILMNGYDEKIINYYCQKCRYLLDMYNKNYGYNFIKKEYKTIVENAIRKLTNSNNSIESHVEKDILKRVKEEKEKQKEYIIKAKDGSAKNMRILYNNYSYLIDVIYDKYKEKIDLNEKDLKKIIKEKYNEFLCAYINGNSNADINKYLSTRLNEYMRNGLYKHICCGTIVNEDNLYLKLIENAIDNVLDFIPKDEAQKQLEEACLNLLRKRSYSKRVNSDLKDSLNACIRNKIKYMNNKYVDETLSKEKCPVKK